MKAPLWQLLTFFLLLPALLTAAANPDTLEKALFEHYVLQDTASASADYKTFLNDTKKKKSDGFQEKAQESYNELLKYQTSEISPSPSYGDAFVQQIISDPETLNPLLLVSSNTVDMLALIFDPLTRINGDLTISPALADSWETSADNMEITYYLKKGILWHDGAPFTADDVKFTFEKILDPESGSPLQNFYQDVDTVEVVDSHEVKIFMKKPTMDLPVSIDTMIIPKHVFEKENFKASEYNRRPIGTGLFEFLVWQPGEQVVLVSNPDYFAGRPFLDRVIYKIIPDNSSAFLSLLRGELDVMMLTPDQYTKQASSKEFRDKFYIYSCPSFAFSCVAYNLNHPILKDRNIRQALTIAIDRQSIIDKARYGFGKPVLTEVLPTHWACDKSLAPYPYDPGLSKKNLAAAGWKDEDGDGILEQAGMKFTLELLVPPSGKLLADIIRDYWKAVGIDVKIRLLEGTKYLEQEFQHNFQASISGWVQNCLCYDPYGLWHSSQIPEKNNGYSGANFISYRNPEIDRLCELSRITFDRIKLKEIYYKIQAIIHKDQPYTFLYTTDIIYAVSKRFHGIEAAPAGIFYNFPHWYVPEELQKY
ncbi:MAG: peptide-binding protein [Candidatus Wallbacteria bacterium]|nr:peptide-binding protein [Candidatus Wallbacteria bacterium]